MTLRRSLVFAMGAIVTMSWSVSAGVQPGEPPADPAARQRFVSLLTSIRTKAAGKAASHDRQGDLRAFGGGGRPPTSRCKP